jgi:hypothetical protein
MKRILFLLMLALVVAHPLGGAQGQTRPHHMGPMMMNSLAMMEADVTVLDTPAGVVLTFTTKPENVADLQRHLERMTATHSARHMDAAPNEAMMQAVATLKYEAIENGARLTLTPKDPAKLAEFQAEVGAHVEMMKKGTCPMMVLHNKS